MKLGKDEQRVLTAIPRLVVGLILLPTAAAAQAPPQMPPEKVAMVFGQEIHYFEAGSGANVILLHGLGADATRWAANIGPLAQKYHVYAPDQIGFGNSAKPLIEYKIGTYVDFLHEFMQTLKIPKATLVGNSLGGWIAADFAIQYPAMVDRLVLVDAAGLSPEGGRTGSRVDLNPATLAGTRQMLEFIIYDKEQVTDEMVRLAFQKRLKGSVGYTIQRLTAGGSAGDQFLDSGVSSIQAATLVLWGREDYLIPLSLGERFQKAIPRAKLTVIEQCGHIPQFEKPAEFNRAVLDFLAQP